MKVRVFTAFSGYDSQCMALDRLKEEMPSFDYELVGWSEIDKYAIKAHNAIYPQWADRNHGDICKIDWSKVPDFDLFTYSFPCTDVSTAGKQGGLSEGSGTRSSLLWECVRAIETKRPRVLLMENVKALMQKKFRPDFIRWQLLLEELGYTNHTQVLNAKDFGVPQNRERVFMVSTLAVAEQSFTFPKPFELKLRLRDVLEDSVDERYYLSDEKVASILAHIDRKRLEGCGFKTNFTDGGGVSGTIKTKEGSREYDTYIQQKSLDASETMCINPKDKNGKQPSLSERVYSYNGISTAITTGWHICIIEPHQDENNG